MALSKINNPFQSSLTGISSPSANTISINTAGTNKITVTNTKIGFGTSSPTGLYEFSDTVTVAPIAGEAQFMMNTSNNSTYMFNNPNGNFGFYNGSSGQHLMYYDRTASTWNIHTGATAKVSINSTGTLSVLAGQIKFPAAQNASGDVNTLDDYEEGYWTPTLYDDGNNVTSANLYVQTAYYIKVGRLVTCVLRISDFRGSPNVLGFSLPFESSYADYTIGVYIPGSVIGEIFAQSTTMGRFRTSATTWKYGTFSYIAAN